MSNNFKGIESLVEVRINDSEDFLKIRETLTRIGICSNKNKELYQSCHILHKKGKYYIVHFKELFGLDGKEITFTEEDISRRNAIANLLNEWGLLTLVEPDKTKNSSQNISNIKVLPYKEKAEWKLIPKYSIGKKK